MADGLGGEYAGGMAGGLAGEYAGELLMSMHNLPEVSLALRTTLSRAKPLLKTSLMIGMLTQQLKDGDCVSSTCPVIAFARRDVHALACDDVGAGEFIMLHLGKADRALGGFSALGPKS